MTKFKLIGSIEVKSVDDVYTISHSQEGFIVESERGYYNDEIKTLQNALSVVNTRVSADRKEAKIKHA